MAATETSPYTLDEPPTSTGRALLSRAFSHWCALHHGFSAEEIAAAFDPEAEIEPNVRRAVHMAARLIGELVASEKLKTVARPIGGGRPVELDAEDWELDDFRLRFARSALDPSRPFEPHADPTHWIFVDLDDFNRVLEISCEDAVPARTAIAAQPEAARLTERAPTDKGREDRLIRRPEVEHRTGMSRATIYRRIAEGRFPRQVEMQGNIAAWWESEVSAWLADPR